MSFFRPSRLSLAILAAAALSTTSAFAQTAPKPAAPAPAKPAAPAPGAPPAGAPGAAQQGPTVVQVKPEPSQPDWVKVCGKDQAANKEICYTTRDFVSDQGQPVLAVAIYDIKGDANRMVRFLMPLGLLLQPGVRFAADQGKAEPGRFAICLPNGCFAEGVMNDAGIAALKKATALNISVQNQFAREVTFQVPLAGFGKAFDGPPIDPAVLEQQQKQLQEQMQKQAEEMRKKLESGGGAAAPGPGVAPAPAPKP
ncbi:invasion associated locus B family protein [Alsobacter sp. SYSU M60028]|uniref:Invasion associated locus B family protein n=1 Tax=Alsobacter ponti TaxID=2962936 RepID=A0ABT1LGW2_9HYPH|nr:invasion associated locus B family protein [Alsobacter ponti]MCP8940739.1 invasion associated locus B family protein [Alsobacter ponti]